MALALLGGLLTGCPWSSGIEGTNNGGGEIDESDSGSTGTMDGSTGDPCLDEGSTGEACPCAGPETGGDECNDECMMAFEVDCATFEEAYVKASNPGRGDGFGWPVALHGDSIAVGADREASGAYDVDGDELDDSVEGAGAVYVFARSGSTWSQQAYIKRPRASVLGFGRSLALRGDTLAVGSNDGVFLFKRSDGTWAPDGELSANHGTAGDQFGCAISLGDDILVVGARFEDGPAEGNGSEDGLPNSGAVYVFERRGSSWVEQAYLKASNAGAEDHFGTSVSLSGSTLAVGADREDGESEDHEDADTRENSGAVYVYSRTPSGWTQDAYLKAGVPGAHDRFGFDVSLRGARLAVGAFGESSAAPGVGGDQSDDSLDESGAVYVFTHAGSSWSREAYLKAPNPGRVNHFGRSVSLRATTLIVGAPGESSAIRGVNSTTDSNWPRADSGAAYVFENVDGAWQHIAHIKASNRDEGDRFGTSVELGDGFVAIGAPGEMSAARGVDGDQSDNTKDGAGAVYIGRIAPESEG